MDKGAPALMIGIGKAEPGQDDDDAPEHGGSPGVMATTAFCKAHESGDYEAAYEHFKEMLLAADKDLEAEGGSAPEQAPPMPA